LDNRPVDIWLPEIADKNRRYDVLYMHDGQMLFDSSMTWNKQVWDVDDIITRLRNENKIREVIVVGIWNNDKSRHADYFPQKAFELLRKEHKELIYSAARSNGYSIFNDYAIRSDDYLKFLVREVKPLIDSLYPTNSSMENTFIAGSSMGGLISLYAICEYPEVFGGAACLSTHWPGIFTMDNNPVPEAFVQYLQQHLPDPKTHKIYFDHGDQTLDALYPPLQKRVDEVMKSKGFTGQNWKTLSFPGEDHSEKAWNKRFDIPLIFLLGR
jgi:enterochelin esterase-like enzyme